MQSVRRPASARDAATCTSPRARRAKTTTSAGAECTRRRRSSRARCGCHLPACTPASVSARFHLVNRQPGAIVAESYSHACARRSCMISPVLGPACAESGGSSSPPFAGRSLHPRAAAGGLRHARQAPLPRPPRRRARHARHPREPHRRPALAGHAHPLRAQRLPLVVRTRRTHSRLPCHSCCALSCVDEEAVGRQRGGASSRDHNPNLRFVPAPKDWLPDGHDCAEVCVHCGHAGEPACDIMPGCARRMSMADPYEPMDGPVYEVRHSQEWHRFCSHGPAVLQPVPRRADWHAAGESGTRGARVARGLCGAVKIARPALQTGGTV